MFNSLTYYRRGNVLSTLIDNKVRVKEIMKEQVPHMDDIGNPYLFGEKFEDKLFKVRNAKQKPIALFTVLQSKPVANHQHPFPKSPLPQNLPKGIGLYPSLGEHLAEVKLLCLNKSS